MFGQAITGAMVIHLCSFVTNGTTLYVMPIEDIKNVAAAIQQEEAKYPGLWGDKGSGPHPDGVIVSDEGCSKQPTGDTHQIMPSWKKPE